MRSWWVTTLLAVATVLAGCATLPVSGPVVLEPRRSMVPGAGGVAIEPDPPAEGASPALIVEGFLHAMATYQPGYAAARRYLTPEAAAAWRPEASVTVYADAAPPTATPDAPVTVIGRVGPDGAYAATPAELRTLDFGLVQTSAGQWRISTPPAGIWISRYLFATSYVRTDVFYLDGPGRRLVPDPRYVAQGNRTPGAVLSLLLSGPSAWLAPGVTSLVPEQAALAGPVSGGPTVLVPLTSAPASPEGRMLFAAQVAASLRQLPGIDGFRLVVDGVPVSVEGQRADGTVPLSVADQLDPVNSLSTQLFALQKNHLVRVSDASTEAPRVVAGDFGTKTWEASALAVSVDGLEAAMVVRTAAGQDVVRGPVDGAGAHVVLSHPAASLLRPQFSATGDLWVMTSDGQLTRVEKGRAVPVPIPSLSGRSVVAFRISPDGGRMAVVVDTNGQRELVLLRAEPSGEWSGWQKVPLRRDSGSVDPVQDVGWSSGTSLTVLVGRDRPAVVEVDIAGVSVREVGLADTWSAVTLATSPRSASRKAVGDSTGVVWLYQGGFRWVTPQVPGAGDAPALRLPAYPG